MTSFVRTIRGSESSEYVEDILGRIDSAIPLPFIPTRAMAGDFVYLAYSGRIVGRARIRSLRPHEAEVAIGSQRKRMQARCIIELDGQWQVPNRQISFQGAQGIRYVDRIGYSGIDTEKWGFA